MLIIGSTAIKNFFPDFPRNPKDLDYVVDKEDNKNSDNTEYLYNPIILKYQNDGYLKPELLLSLKISHLFHDINWFKHIFDVQFLLSKGIQYNKEIVDELIPFWNDLHKKVKKSNLTQSKEDFFSNAVNEDTLQHDYIHTLINPIPMYTLLLKDGAEVELDENKWHNLSYEDKTKVVAKDNVQDGVQDEVQGDEEQVEEGPKDGEAHDPEDGKICKVGKTCRCKSR
jgi:hypothetical protein